MRTATREYSGKNVNLDKLGQLIVEFFNEEHFKTQTVKHPNGILIQAKKGGVFRTILAMDRAFTIIIEGDQSDFKVKIGVSAWLMDLGIAAIETFFVAGALAFIEVPEALWSYEIEHQLWHYVENQVELGIQ
jgi:hypothetical protein